MIIYAIDDEALSLEGLSRAIFAACPKATVRSFRSAKEALALAEKEAPDAAFLDIEMRDMNGIEAARLLRERYPKVNIIFSTGYEEYMSDAFRLHASGYITKPITKAKVLSELSDLRHPGPASPTASSSALLAVRAFGTFQVYKDDHPITFGYAKARELFAFLIDRKGELVTSGLIMDALWEDSEGTIRHSSYLRNLRSDLRRVLEDAGTADVLVQKRGLIGVNRALLSCDYYDFLDGKLPADAFKGEYMSQYSWGEWRLPELMDLQERLLLRAGED